MKVRGRRAPSDRIPRGEAHGEIGQLRSGRGGAARGRVRDGGVELRRDRLVGTIARECHVASVLLDIADRLREPSMDVAPLPRRRAVIATSR